MNAVVFDLETTGLSPQKDGIVELGALKIVAGRVVEEDPYQTLVRPENMFGQLLNIPPRAQKVHGISDAMVSGAPTIGEVLPAFLAWAGDAPVVAHNVKFDSGFMRVAAQRFGLAWRPRAEICTVRLSRLAFPAERQHNLDALSRRLGLEIVPAERHRSLGDVRLTAAAYLRLADILAERGQF